MQVFNTPHDMQAWALTHSNIAFAPTMGALHAGHLYLVELAKNHGEHVVVSIFVNPTHFNDAKDFDKYPRTLEDDLSKLEALKVDAVFCPQAHDMYAAGSQTQVSVSSLTELWEGAIRPGHFQGVCTVVAKLFHIVQPQTAIFGEKDFQQVRVIERMVQDLFFPLQIIRGECIRESDGLALSSRNVRLSAEERKAALGISAGLRAAQELACAGEGSAEKLLALLRSHIETSELAKIDYAALVAEESLLPIEQLNGEAARMLVAVQYPSVRLIDNRAILQ